MRLTVRNMLSDSVVSDIMTRDCHELPARLTLDVAIEQHLITEGRRCYTVVGAEGVHGLLTIHSVRDVPRVEWPFTHVGDVLTPLDQLRTAQPETPLWEVMQEMATDGVNQMPVIADGVLEGMITRESLLTFIRDRSRL